MPVAGPISAYPTESRPASICFSESNDFPVASVVEALPGLVAGVAACVGMAAPSSKAVIVVIAAPRK